MKREIASTVALHNFQNANIEIIYFYLNEEKNSICLPNSVAK